MNDIFLSHMPAYDAANLYKVLARRDAWEQVALQMKYTATDIEDFKAAARPANMIPAEYLIAMYSEANHTVAELFVVLYNSQQYDAMVALKNLVHPKYHVLLEKTEKILNVSKMQSRETNETHPYPTPANNNNNNPDNHQPINVVDILHIDYNELKEATNTWQDSNVLGKGGYGVVYKGLFKETLVAIKIVNKKKMSFLDSLNELKYLNSCRHDNILAVYGHSIDGPEHCLIYQYMSGKSLDERIFKPQNASQILDWLKRINIAIGTAKGLQYLHRYKGKPLIHGDIKPGNILLDQTDQPKIGDFGLAREGKIDDEAMQVSSVRGTEPYLPTDFIRNRKLTTKVDTFSFGVVLLELVTGMRAFSKSTYHFLSKHILNKKQAGDNLFVELLDKNLPSIPHSDVAFDIIIDIGLLCTKEQHDERPEMLAVYRDLQNRFNS